MRYLFLLALLAVVSCAAPAPVVLPDVPGAPPLLAVPISALPGWEEDDTAAALAAFVRSCVVIQRLPVDQSLGGIGRSAAMAGEAGLWDNACNGAKSVAPGDKEAAQAYFAAYFTAYRIAETALITGYFEPEYAGSKNKAPGYDVPLYAKPADPELVDLPRAAIDNGALDRKTPVTAYLDDPVNAFMLQIQGAGRISLPNGDVLRVGFDGQNGQPYTPIGRVMVADGDLASGNVSYQTISQWLKAHPAQAQAIMEQNARYVYMRPLGGIADEFGAPGTLGVPLTPLRSLAVDRADIPLGVPVYLATTNPLTGAALDELTVAQDTGGGIHEAQAADLFAGSGAQAEALAGHMQQHGSLFLLLPRPVAGS